MEATPSQLISFFNGFKQSLIPLFQRPYEWSEQNWGTLWSDVVERYEADKELSHFMGAIVSMPAKSVPVGVSKYLIIDGQQRLTTIALLLCALRDELPAEAKPQRNRIQNHYLVNDGYDGLDHIKLLPTQVDRAAFQALVEGTAEPPLSKVRSGYEYFRKMIRTADTDLGRIDPVRLLEIIERRLMVVNINLGDADDPYLIFESLNFKGSPLTQADLVRNYFLMRFPLADQQRIYDESWLPMQERMGDHLTEFMRHYLMKDGEEVLKGEIYSILKKRLQELDSKVVEQELRAMARLSQYYLKLVHPEREEDPVLQHRLIRLRRLDVATANPLLLRAYDAHAQGLIKTSEFAEVLELIESFVVRRIVCSVPTNQLKKIFLGLAKGFPESQPVAWLVGQLTPGAAGRRWPKDDEFKEAWIQDRMYARKVCRIVLEALEEAHEHKEPASITQATIEHVMPQTITDEWRKELGADADAKHERLCDTIGNLTLSAYNSELSNQSFAKKKELYAASHYEMNKYFATVQEWGEQAILERAGALFDKAREIWPRPEPAPAS